MLDEALAGTEFATLCLLICDQLAMRRLSDLDNRNAGAEVALPLKGVLNALHSLGQQINTTAHLCKSYGETNRRNESSQDIPDIDGRIECHSSIPSAISKRRKAASIFDYWCPPALWSFACQRTTSRPACSSDRTCRSGPALSEVGNT